MNAYHIIALLLLLFYYYYYQYQCFTSIRRALSQSSVTQQSARALQSSPTGVQVFYSIAYTFNSAVDSVQMKAIASSVDSTLLAATTTVNIF
jgi:hypothetical protein